MPIPCAARCVAIQSSGCSLPGAISFRTRSAKTSAPPPGSEPRPASLRSARTCACGETRELGHVVDLGRGEELQVDVGQRLVQRSGHAGVVVVADVGVLAADHVDLAVALALVHLDGVGDQVGDVPRVGALLPARARERAELALHPAHVGVVQVQVVDEEDLVGAPAQPPGAVGQLAEREHVVALEERDPVVEIEPLAGDHLVADGCERVQMGGNGHEQAESTHSGSLDGS